MSKNYLLWHLLGPITWPFWALLLAAILPQKRHAWVKPTLKYAGIAWLGAMLFTPLGTLLIRPLENFAPRNQLPVTVSAIVVLTGGEALKLSAAIGQPQISSAGNRLLAARLLAQAHRQAKVIVVGGVHDQKSGLRDLDVARALLLGTGLEPQRLHLIDNTKDTCSNAEGLRAYFDKTEPSMDKNIVLITSAFHMPRTLLCFEAQSYPGSLALWPYPVDYYANPNKISIDIADPVENLRRVDYALHEWIGLLYYRLSGRTAKLWPEPVNNPSQALPNAYPPLTDNPKKP